MEDNDPAEVRRRHRLLQPYFYAQVVSLVLVASLLGLLVWKISHGSSGARLVAAIKRGDAPAAPGFDLPVVWERPVAWPAAARPALADGRVSLAELKGTPVVLNFWASWCIPCKKEAPAFASAAGAHGRRIAFLGLNIQDLVPDAKRFLRRLDVPYPSVRDSGQATYTAYGLTGVPETFFIDGRGRILAHAVGAVTRDELEPNIALLTRRP